VIFDRRAAESLSNHNEEELQRRCEERQQEIDHMQQVLETKIQILQEVQHTHSHTHTHTHTHTTPHHTTHMHMDMLTHSQVCITLINTRIHLW